MYLWLMLSSPATHSRTADTAITASAPCVCLICVCSFVITKGGETNRVFFFFFCCSFFFFFLLCITGPKSGNLKTQGERESRQIQETVKPAAIKHSLGNYLPVIRPSCFEYQRDSNSQTNSERLTNFVLCQMIADCSRGRTFEPPRWR